MYVLNGVCETQSLDRYVDRFKNCGSSKIELKSDANTKAYAQLNTASRRQKAVKAKII